MSRRRRITCQEFVELVTDLLDDALDPEQQERVDRHLEACPDCARTVAQWRVVIGLTGRLGEADAGGHSPTRRAGLLEAFRDRPD